jgi:hypothetical protein
MTLLIAFHNSGFRDFKTYYTRYVCQHWQDYFPELVSYTRMLKLLQTALVPLCTYMKQRRAKTTGIAFIDSTTLKVCHNLRIPRHKVFANEAQRGKGTIGWFYGFKLHLIIIDECGILAVKVTPGNVDDRKPVLDMTDNVTGRRLNMKPQPISAWDKAEY